MEAFRNGKTLTDGKFYVDFLSAGQLLTFHLFRIFMSTETSCHGNEFYNIDNVLLSGDRNFFASFPVCNMIHLEYIH